MAWPNAPRVDRAGNLWFCATGNNRALKLDAKTGLIVVAAGNGLSGYAGDGGPGPGAQLNQPASLVVDGADNVFIADTQNHAIRRLDAKTGILTTIAGNGTPGFEGDGGPAPRSPGSISRSGSVSTARATSTSWTRSTRASGGSKG